MPDSKVDQLARVPLFAKTGPRELKHLASEVDEVSIPAGKTLITEGGTTDTFYILTSGNVQVTRKGKPIARLGPGDFFGEIGMLSRAPAVATVVTEGPAEVLVLSHAQFRDAIKANDQLAMQVISAMAERLRQIVVA